MPLTSPREDEGVIGQESPPAYELSQQAFDDKTSRAILASSYDPPPKQFDDDGFEVWDDAIYRAQRALHETCEPPSQYSQPHSPTRDSAETASSSSRARDDTTPSPMLRRSTKASSRRRRKSRVWTVRNEIEEEYVVPVLPAVVTGAALGELLGEVPLSPTFEGESEPPPVFTPIGPSLDGPAYEEVVLTYEGAEPSPSASLDNLLDVHSSVHHSISSPASSLSHEDTRTGEASQAMPFDGVFLRPESSLSVGNYPQPIMTLPPADRNASPSIPTRNNHTSPIVHIVFDPKLAYSGGDRNTPDTMSERRNNINPAALAFYSPAVSAQLSNTTRPLSQTPSQVTPRYSSLGFPRRS